MASRAEEYRRRAQQCLEMARTFTNRQVRDTLSHMAQVWLRVAEGHDRPPTAPGQKRPAVQQQQQIQPKGDSKKE